MCRREIVDHSDLDRERTILVVFIQMGGDNRPRGRRLCNDGRAGPAISPVNNCRVSVGRIWVDEG